MTFFSFFLYVQNKPTEGMGRLSVLKYVDFFHKNSQKLTPTNGWITGWNAHFVRILETPIFRNSKMLSDYWLPNISDKARDKNYKDPNKNYIHISPVILAKASKTTLWDNLKRKFCYI